MSLLVSHIVVQEFLSSLLCTVQLQITEAGRYLFMQNTFKVPLRCVNQFEVWIVTVPLKRLDSVLLFQIRWHVWDH